jgi:hypothetical protein
MEHAFTRGLDYASVVATSERVAWTVDGVFRERRFDPSTTIVPSSWVGTASLGFLDEQAQRTLAHCRAFSYVHLLGNFEDFVPLHLTGVVGATPADGLAQRRALLRFAEEELKHQQLFRRAELVLEESCGHRFGRYFDEGGTRVGDLTSAMLDYSPLARFLIVLALEWGTQRHYVESVRERTEGAGDPLYADVLEAHWLEEAQHTKCGTLEIGRGRPEEAERAFADLAAIARHVDTVFAGQADAEVETLEHVTGRAFRDAERAVLRATLHRSLSTILAGVGLGHPRFTAVARALSPGGAATLGIA